MYIEAQKSTTTKRQNAKLNPGFPGPRMVLLDSTNHRNDEHERNHLHFPMHNSYLLDGRQSWKKKVDKKHVYQS